MLLLRSIQLPALDLPRIKFAETGLKLATELCQGLAVVPKILYESI